MHINIKRTFPLIWLMLLLCLSASYAQHYGQTFQLTNSPANAFSIDRMGQQIYFSYYGAVVYKLDLKSAAVTSTGLVHYPPTFGNKRHIMLFGDTLYDLDNRTSYGITPSDSLGNFGWNFAPSFSPNDSSLMFYGPGVSEYRVSNYVFSLKDSSLTPIDTSVQAYLSCGDHTSPQWSSDTSFVYDVNCHAIVEYFIMSRRIDTLVSTSASIMSFAYSTKHNILAYAEANGYSFEIHFCYGNSREDSSVLSQSKDPNDVCWPALGGFGFLTWSPGGDKLGFIAGYMTEPVTETGIYFYSLDSNRTYKTASCPPLQDYDQYLQWLNDDTLCYVDQTQASIYGMNILPVIDEVNGNMVFYPYMTSRASS